jgi:hypothetical protein
MAGDLQKYLPDAKTWLRAAVTTIPVVGGALDHLLFDKADAIRLQNLEAALRALSARIAEVPEPSVDKSWFASEEALAAMRFLTEKVGFEPDKQRINDMGRVVAACGLHPQSSDPRKLSALEHLSRLSPIQIRLLKVVAGVPTRTKTISGGSISQTVTAVWTEDVKTALQSGHSFWEGALNLVLELEVLESLNTLRRVGMFGGSDQPYALTALGRHAAGFVQAAGL